LTPNPLQTTFPSKYASSSNGYPNTPVGIIQSSPKK
jgi:hypothetical protein